MNFHFPGSYLNDVSNKNDSYLWSKKKLKIKEKDLNLTFVTFWNLLAVKSISRKLLKLKEIHESRPTARELIQKI